MKKQLTLSTLILLAAAGCGGGNNRPADDFATIDVTTDYPEKELILQDILDVEYIPLETTDEFVTQGAVLDVGKDIIMMRNYLGDGDIFVFDRNGKALRKINRKGQSREEYTGVSELVLDEENNEMFVSDYSAREIIVYDLYGKFKRNFKFADTGYYTYIFNYDKDHLICYKSYVPANARRPCHLILSKQDGSVVREIPVPFKEIKTSVFSIGEAMVTIAYHQIVPSRGGWILQEASSDTTYRYSPDHTLHPVIVRKPSIRSMDPEVHLYPVVLTDRYYFVHTMKKEFDLETMQGFPSADLVYDKQENALYQSILYNDDFLNKKKVYLTSNPVNQEIASWIILQAPDLVEAYKDGQLKGRLAEIAAGMDEEDNPVILLLKHKK
jgi:hypothetical protein